MEHINYVRRCKNKTDAARHETMHAADNYTTFCGSELNEMWFVESSARLSPSDVTCHKCRAAMAAAEIGKGMK